MNPGKKYGRLTSIRFSHKKNGYPYWLFRCDCGNLKNIHVNNVVSGKSKSCGCLRKELQTKHGYHDKPIYHIWEAIVQRCYNKNNSHYKHYGERGIMICDEWRSNPALFIEWALSNGYKKGLTIDRTNNDGNYEPDNCRFVDYRTNNLNRKQDMKNTSGFVGVWFRKDRKKWTSRITIFDKTINLGCFKTLLEAVSARNKYIMRNGLFEDYLIQNAVVF